jgi:nucleoside-diphosphate kinase
MLERTLIIVKPDAIQRHLAGQIITRFERKGLKLVAAKFIKISDDLTRKLYAVHKGKPFYEKLVAFITASPIFVMVWEAENVIEIVRKMLGETFGYDAQPGTIRGDFSMSGRYNLVHGSDSPESAQQEINLFFKADEILNYKFADADWLDIRNL